MPSPSRRSPRQLSQPDACRCAHRERADDAEPEPPVVAERRGRRAGLAIGAVVAATLVLVTLTPMLPAAIERWQWYSEQIGNRFDVHLLVEAVEAEQTDRVRDHLGQHIGSVLAVPVAKRLGLGSVLGYLLAGVAIGPFGLKFVGDSGAYVMHFAEFGVVMMLFLVGLELEPRVMWRMKWLTGTAASGRHGLMGAARAWN